MTLEQSTYAYVLGVAILIAAITLTPWTPPTGLVIAGGLVIFALGMVLAVLLLRHR